MNYLDPLLNPQREARLKYLDGEFQILREGEFVRCAVTGDPIHMDNLRYWSVDRQVAFKSAQESYAANFKPV
jgi:hypothetical protein